MYLSFHSYGQKIIYPWSYTSQKIHDWQDLDRVGRVMARAIHGSSNGKYFYKVICSTEMLLEIVTFATILYFKLFALSLSRLLLRQCFYRLEQRRKLII